MDDSTGSCREDPYWGDYEGDAGKLWFEAQEHPITMIPCFYNKTLNPLDPGFQPAIDNKTSHSQEKNISFFELGDMYLKPFEAKVDLRRSKKGYKSCSDRGQILQEIRETWQGQS